MTDKKAFNDRVTDLNREIEGLKEQLNNASNEKLDLLKQITDLKSKSNEY